MGVPIAAERRLLSENEYDFVLRSHYPHLEGLPRDELVELARWLRSQRARARDIVRHRRRVRRGKSDPRNAAAETASERGLAAKKQVFSRSLKRVNARLHHLLTEEKHARNMTRLNAALKRRRNAPVHHPAAGRRARKGMRPVTNPKADRIMEPAEIGRVSQAVRDAQSRRDDRGR